MMVTRAEHVPTEIIEANEGEQDLTDEIKLRGKNPLKKVLQQEVKSLKRR